MTSKTSQKTEDMLDQTFQNFDSEQTITATHGGGSAPPSKNSNLKLMIGLGAACIFISAYVLVIRPALDNSNNQQSNGIQPAQVAVNVPQPAQQSQPEQQTQQPVQVPTQNNPVDNQIQPPQVQQINSQVPDVNQQQPVMNVQVTGQPVPVQSPVAQQSGINPAVQQSNDQQMNQQMAQNMAQQMPPNVNTSLPVMPQSNVSMPDQQQIQNAQQQAVTVDVNQNGQQQVEVKVDQPKVVANFVVDDIVARLDKQNTEFKAIFTDIDGKLVSIQNTITEQKDINQKVDNRLSALESKGVQPSSDSVKKQQTSHSSVKQAKSKVEKTEVVIKEKDITEKITIKAKSPAKVSIHSIYGGRVWIKNSDGSLSTYSAGDKLPNGEVIKVVDDENLEIVTDSRVIKN